MGEDTRGTRACRRLEDGTAVYAVGGRDPSIRLDLFLKERIPRLSRRRIQEAIRVRVRVPGRGAPKPSTLLRPGDTVVVMPSLPPCEPEPEDRIPVLYRDEDLLVIDKPAGLLAHPSNHVRKGSVAYILSRDLGARVHLVHRLDRETSGVMVIARSASAARLLAAQMARHAEGAEKRYLAIVSGEVKVREAVIDLPIGRAARSAVYVKRGVNRSEGRPSRTQFRLEAVGGGFSLVRILLHTGRRHQVRVHMAAIGHPVVGDKLYGPAESHYLRFLKGGLDERMRRDLLTDRHMLHAERISFRHPRDGRLMSFAARPPDDMRQFLLRAGITA